MPVSGCSLEVSPPPSSAKTGRGKKGGSPRPKGGRRAATVVPPPAPGWGASARGAWWSILLLVVAGGIVYGNNLHGEFNFDDFDTVVDNPTIRSLPSFWSSLWAGPDSPNTPLSGRPIVGLTFALNFLLGGLDVVGYHLVNNLCHILAGLAFFGLVRQTLLSPRFAEPFGRMANGWALSVAILWLVHPLHTEAVDYLTQRTEIMMGFFALLTLFAAVVGFQAADRPGPWYALAVIACLLGMGCKEVMVSVPVLVLLIDRLVVGGGWGEVLRRRRWFYLALAATWGVLLVFQLNSSRASTLRFDLPDLGPLDYLRTQLGVVVHYLRLAFWPWPLVLDSQDWPIAYHFSADLILPAVILGGLLAATGYGLWRSRWWSVPGALFFLTLAPTSSLLPVYTEIVAERRMYLPLAAVLVVVVFGVASWAGRWVVTSRARLGLAWGAVGVLTVLFGVLTWQRNLDYRTSVGLWQDSVAKRPGNSRAYNNLGEALVREGRMAEAVPPFREAARLQTSDGEHHSYSNLGATLASLGQLDEALVAHRRALELAPQDAEAHYDYGNTLLRVGDQDGARAAFARAIELNPNLFQAHGNLGILLLQQGDLSGAEGHLQTLLRLMPQLGSGQMFLGDLRMKQGRRDEALALYQEALSLQPDSPEILERLAAARTAAGK